MRHGGKKWSGSHDSILFFFQREMERGVSRDEKAEEWEQHFHYRRQNEGDDKEDDEEEVDAQRRAYLECVEKKEELSIPLTLFRRKTLTYEKYHKEEAKISSSLERTERDQKHEKERERAFLFFTLFHISHCSA